MGFATKIRNPKVVMDIEMHEFACWGILLGRIGHF